MISKKILIYQANGPPFWYTGLVRMGLKIASPWKHPESGTSYLRERIPAAIVEMAKGRTIAIPDDETCSVKVGNMGCAGLASIGFRQAARLMRINLI